MRFNGTEDHTSGLSNTTPTSSSLSRRGSQLSVPQSLKAVTIGHPVSLAGSCAQTRGECGLDMQALGASRWSMVMPSPAPSRRCAGAVLSDPGTQWGDYSPLGCPSAVDWVSGLEGPCPARSQHLSQGTWEPCSQWARHMCQVCVGGGLHSP